MKKLLLATIIGSALAAVTHADTNIRIDPLYTIGGSLTGGADFYLNDQTAIGGTIFSSRDRAKLGVRYTRHLNDSDSSQWLFVADANLIGYRQREWKYEDPEDYNTGKEVQTDHLAGELRVMQQHRWQWQSGFNTTLGLGAFAVIDPDGKYDTWYTDEDFILPVYGMGEWSVGWRF